MGIGIEFNYLAVILSAIVGFLIGWLWHGPIFGKKWKEYMGFKKEDHKENAKKKGMPLILFAHFAALLIMAGVLASIMESVGIPILLDGVTVSFFVWLGFVATIMIERVLWDRKPLGLFWINSLHWLVVLLIMGLILSLWPTP